VGRYTSQAVSEELAGCLCHCIVPQPGGDRPRGSEVRSLWLLASSIAREVLERDRLWLLASSIAREVLERDRLLSNLHKFADIILNILARK